MGMWQVEEWVYLSIGSRKAGRRRRRRGRGRKREVGGGGGGGGRGRGRGGGVGGGGGGGEQQLINLHTIFCAMYIHT